MPKSRHLTQLGTWAAGAVKQCKAQSVFKLRQLLAQRGLRHIKQLRGAGQIAQLGDMGYQAQMLDSRV